MGKRGFLIRDTNTTADSKGVIVRFFITAESKRLSGIFQGDEKMGARREAQGQRRPKHAEG